MSAAMDNEAADYGDNRGYSDGRRGGPRHHNKQHHHGRGRGRHHHRHSNGNSHNQRHNRQGDDALVSADGALMTPRYPSAQQSQSPGRGQGWGRGGYGGGRGRGRGGYSGRRGVGRYGVGARLPRNIRERPEDDPMPEDLKTCAKVLTELGDATTWAADDEGLLLSNITGAAGLFVMKGYTTGAGGGGSLCDDLSNLFVKCLAHMPVQGPIIATVLALLNTCHGKSRGKGKGGRKGGDNSSGSAVVTVPTPHAFVEVVVSKLCAKLEHCLHEANVPKAKLLLRALACLVACGTVQCGGDSGFVRLLDNLFNALQPQMAGAALSLHNTVVVYLLVATVPWCLESLLGCAEGQALLRSIQEYCTARVLPSTRADADRAAATADGACYSSAFAVGGKHASFMINWMSSDEDASTPSVAGAGPEVWDTLQRQCIITCSMLSQALGSVDAGNTAKSAASAANSCMYMPMPWTTLQVELASTTNYDNAGGDDDDDDGMDSADDEDSASPAATAAAAADVAGVQVIPLPAVAHQSSPPAAEAEEGVGEAAGSSTASLTAQSITDYLLHGLITHRPDVEYATVENRETRDRNAAVGSWLGLVCPVFDAARSPPPAAGTDLSSTPACMRCLSPVDRAVLGDYIRDIVLFFEPYIRADGTYVGTTTTLAQHLLNLYKLYPLHIAMHGSSPTASAGLTPMVQAAVDYLVVETLFQLLLQLPPVSAQCLHRVMLELCRISPAGMPRIVAAGCVELYQLAPAMDTEAWKAVTSYLSFHLVNFKLAWPYWDYWAQEFGAGAGATAQSDGDEMAESAGTSASTSASTAAVATHDVSKAFILDLVDRCSRLSFPTAMRAALPAALHVCIPQQDVSSNVNSGAAGGIKPPLSFALLTDVSDGDSSSSNDAALTPHQRATNELYRRMSSRGFTTEAVEEWLDDQYFDEHGQDVDPEQLEESTASELWKCCALMECVVFISGGGVTLSGVASTLDRFCELLRSYAYNTDNGQQAMLDTLYHIYAASADWGLMDVLLDMLLRRNIVSALVATQWLVGSEAADIGTAALLLRGETEVPALPSARQGGLLVQITNVCRSGAAAGHPWVWSHVDTVVKRSFDFVVAAEAKKTELQAEVATLLEQIEAAAEAGAADAEDDDEDRQRSKRRRRGRSADEDELEGAMAAVDERDADAMDEPSENAASSSSTSASASTPAPPAVPLPVLRSRLSSAQQTLEVVTNGLALSVSASQDIFTTLVVALMSQIDARCKELVGMQDGGEEEVQLDALFVTLLSALKKTLRMFEHHQIALNCEAAGAGTGEVWELAKRSAVVQKALPVLSEGPQGNAAVLQVWSNFA